MRGQIRIGIFQLRVGEDKEENLSKVKDLVKKERLEADLLVFPEYLMADITYLSPEEVYELSESLNGSWVKFFRELSKEYSAYILTTLFERTRSPPKVRNTAVLISPEGEVIAAYRKIHLFDALDGKESNYMIPGSEPSPISDVKGVKVAMAVCFDPG